MRRLVPTVLTLLMLLAGCRVASEPTPPSTTPTPAATVPPPATPTAALAADVRTPTPAPTPNLPPVTAPAWAADMILYQVFVRSFVDSNGDGVGDLNGIVQRLDYLQELGVNTLWLTPIFSAPSYHGYDTTDYYAINPDFGTRDDLVRLVAEAHRRGIRVLLDYVAGHTSNQHPFFKDALGRPDSKYAEFYRWTDPGHTKYEGFSGLAELPSLNHASPAVQQYLIDVAKHWLDLDGDGDYKDGIDGFRADYALGVSHDFWKRLRREVKSLNPDTLLLAEVWRGGALELRPYFLDEFDAAFDFPLYGALQGNHDRVGDGVLPGQASPQLVQGELLVAPRIYPSGALRVSFINNHDTNRAMSDFEGDLSQARTAARLLFSMPPPPMVYYGEEIGMQGVKGGEGVWDITRREPMDWYTPEEGPGMTRWWKPAGRNNKPADGVSVEEQRGQPGSLLEHYKALTRLRRESAALRAGTYEPVRVEPADKALAFVRRASDDTVLAVFNFGPAPVTVTLDLSETGLVYATYAATDALTGQPASDVRSPAHQIALPAGGSTLLNLRPR